MWKEEEDEPFLCISCAAYLHHALFWGTLNYSFTFELNLSKENAHVLVRASKPKKN